MTDGLSEAYEGKTWDTFCENSELRLENDELKAENAKLRELVRDYERCSVHADADRIDAEHERAMADAYLSGTPTDEKLTELGWIRLPKDADGEYIHAGDVLDGYGKTIEVVELRHGRSGWVLISRDGNGYADTFAFTHHKPSVEDVLREFAARTQMLGCVEDEYALVSEYAARLRLAEEDA